jgi:putative SOS response-associated peptidase YedK
VTLKTSSPEVAQKFLVEMSKELRDGLRPRYNIAPSQGLLTVWDDRDAGWRKADFFHWGLVPRWADDVKIGYKLINARSETAAEKPSFRHAMRYRRCLFPVDGFYEWEREGKVKTPHYFQVDEGSLFAMAGLWEVWQSPDGSEILSCSVLTTGPNEVMAPIHDRMPVILDESDYDRWLDPALQHAEEVADLLKPFDPGRMSRHRVSEAVNSARHDGPELILPVEDTGKPPQALDFFDSLFPGGES